MENIKYIVPSHYAEVILRLSKKISKLAQQHEWQSAREVEEQRNIAMLELFSHPDINDALPTMTDILYQVMELDAEVIVKGEMELKNMTNQLYGLNKGKRVVNAYLKT